LWWQTRNETLRRALQGNPGKSPVLFPHSPARWRIPCGQWSGLCPRPIAARRNLLKPLSSSPPCSFREGVRCSRSAGIGGEPGANGAHGTTSGKSRSILWNDLRERRQSRRHRNNQFGSQFRIYSDQQAVGPYYLQDADHCPAGWRRKKAIPQREKLPAYLRLLRRGISENLSLSGIKLWLPAGWGTSPQIT